MAFPKLHISSSSSSKQDRSRDVLTVDISQRRIDLSSDPEASVFESGLQAIVDIPARCPSRMCSCLPVEVSHILIVASAAEKAQVSQGNRFQIGTAYNNSQCIDHQAKI